MGVGAAERAIDIGQMTGMGMAAQAGKAGVKYIRGVNEKNALKAIKKLLTAKPSTKK